MIPTDVSAKDLKKARKTQEVLKGHLMRADFDKDEAMLQQTRVFFFTQANLCAVMQMLLITLSLYQIFVEKTDELAIVQHNPFILLARLFAAIILHLSLVQTVNAGLERMKFAVNHSYLFCYPF